MSSSLPTQCTCGGAHERLKYLTGQTWLIAVTVQVERCDNCAKPTARLAGPNFFRTPCDLDNGQFSTIFISSDGSGDASGRPLISRTWGFKTGEHENGSGRSLTCADPPRELMEIVGSSNG